MASINAERSKIVGCAAQLRATGTEAQQKAGAEAYANAKTAMDGVLDDLVLVLSEKKVMDAKGFEARLQSSIKTRIAFCKTAEATAPKGGEKQIFQDVYTDTLKPTMDAVLSLFGRRTAPASERRTVTTQLEAARWPEYSSVPPVR
ncbi:MAG: hypothetical protein NW223_06285 [Hyphomicrobiaceae bacterium]|nr:hypothetical protein [Hyphomicrobiaceae bacterium]